ncbi:unnamed protein product [Meganyctiphanes norvegica]|uniref:Uncharacterized protein n=1 Tax=Meganyctiphanes norvegica TaxID=48144 RepID=A0AAV2RBK5_MEGNR
MNFRNSSSMDTKIFYNNKRIKEESNLKSKSKSVYDMDSDSEPEGNENKNETDWQRYRYSSKSRFSDLVKSKRNSKGKSKFDSDEESTDGENSKILKVRYPKPKKYMIDLHDYTLKDIKEFKNSKKRKPFTPNNDSEDEEQKIIRTSSRKRNTVNYVDYRASDASSSEDESSNYEDSSEDGEANASEDENRNRIKKKVESPVIMFKKTPLSEYEQMVERNKEANRKMLEEMGLFQAKNDLEAKNNPQEPKKK